MEEEKKKSFFNVVEGHFFLFCVCKGQGSR